jgi:murein DD-endopeptidase MepM/ murein hydrolase activator NlpD
LILLALGSNEACTRPPKAPVPPPISIQKCVKENYPFVEAKKIHYVEKGETLFQISNIYGIPVEKIALANGIKDLSHISVGQAIVIPGTVYSNIIWPVRGKISSYYGKRRGRGFHAGIDIVASKGTPIKAAADGLVIASGKGLDGFSKYGRIVILDHGNGVRTIYAHNKKNNVRSGSCIRTGDVLGEVGDSGNATGPHLHFEIRKYGNPLNPILYLP